MKYLLFELAINANSKYLEEFIIFTIIKKLLRASSWIDKGLYDGRLTAKYYLKFEFFWIGSPKSNIAFTNKIKIYRIINDILKNMISDPKINIQNFKFFALMLFKIKNWVQIKYDVY